MIEVLFVGDGDRDAIVVPVLVERILGVAIQPQTTHWARLHKSGGRGYGRKLKYALTQARDRNVRGVVATLDTDTAKHRARLKELQGGREQDRAANAKISTALGEATPHGEAWVLDDAMAVQAGLRLSPEATIPTTKDSPNPKKTLHGLFKRSPRADEPFKTVLADLARRIDPGRYAYPKETGYRAFATDVRTEFRIVTSAGA